MKMRLTNKNTGFSFNLNPKETADFFYAKNAKREFINKREDYTLEDNHNEVSTFKFFIGMVGMIILTYCSLYLYFQWNY
jgi:hypothetical protein